MAPSPAELRLKREIAALKSLLPSPIGVGNQFPSSASLSKKRQRVSSIEELGGLNSSTTELMGADDNSIRGGKDIELIAEKLARERDAERYSMALGAADSIRAKLERQVDFLAGEEEAARKELVTKQRIWLEEKMALQSELKQERDLINVLEDKNHKMMQAAMEANDTTGKLHTQAISQSTNVEIERVLREELEMALKFLAEVRQELNNTCMCADLAEKKAEAAAQDMTTSLRMTVNDLERRLHSRDATIENLKKDQQGKEELREHILSLQSKLELVKKQLRDEQEASASFEMLKEEKLEWEAMFSKLFESSATPPTPSMALKLLTKVQKDNIYLKARATQWETRAAQATERLKLARSEAAAEATRRASAEASLEEIRLRLQGETRKANTLEKELAAKKEVIKSFRLSPPGLSGGKREDRMEKNTLEVALDTARLELEELRGEVVSSTPGKVLQKTQERVHELEDMCRKLEQERCAATKQLERVERELAVYEREAAMGIPIEGKGRSAAGPTSKILHLISNPAAIALAKAVGEDRCESVEAVLMENNKDPLDEALREESNSSSISSISSRRRRTAKISGKSSGKVQEEEVDKDKVNLRLKEKFKERIATFRNAIYFLTGYKIDMTTEGDVPQLRLRSMYSEQENDDLVFQWNKEGLQLMETPFAKHLDRKIFTYLSTCNSVPAFLSNLTLELFEKRTFAPGSTLSA